MTGLPLVATLVAFLAQAQPIEVGVNSLGKFAFDWSGEYADGTPMAETASVEFHYMPVPPGPGDEGGHRAVKLPLAAVTGENVIPMKDALQGIPEGVYDLSALLVGVGGNRSAHSTPVLAVRVRVKNPDAPTALRVVGN
jgi:hypothetical protein